MANYSTFVAPDYIVDSFQILSTLPASQYANAILLNQLRALTNPTPDQIAQINSLTTTLAPYNISPDQWNAFSQAVMNMESLILQIVNFKDMGTWSSSVGYSMWNTVKYNGSTYISKQNSNTNNIPTGLTGDLWWSLVAQKGDTGLTGATGQQGNPGLGLVYTGNYNAGTTYIIGNAVNYNNNIYYCISTSTGNLPTNGTYWNIFLSNTGIVIQNTAPSSPYNSEIWVDTSTSQNLMKYWDGSSWVAISTYNASQISIADAGNLFTATNVEDALQESASKIAVLNGVYAVATGSANTYAVTLSPAPTSYTDGMLVVVKINVASTGASTLNVNGLGAKSIKDSLGNAINSGGLKANIIYSLRYEYISGNFIVQGKGGGGNAVAGHLLLGDTATVDTGQIIGTLDLSQLVTGNIRAGVTINGVTGLSSVVNTSDANAVASQILSGLYAYVNGLKITGTMPNNGATGGIITNQSGTYTIPAGYTTGGTVTANITNLIASNIINTAIVGGITGTAVSINPTVGDKIVYDDPIVRTSTNATTPTKISARYTMQYSGSIRIKHRINDTGTTTHSQVYKNGSAVGTDRVQSGTQDIIYTEDFTCSAGDYFEIWGYVTNSSYTYWLKDVQLCATNSIVVMS